MLMNNPSVTVGLRPQSKVRPTTEFDFVLHDGVNHQVKDSNGERRVSGGKLSVIR
jgi:hypothetical protein